MKIGPVFLALGAALLLFKDRLTAGINNIAINPASFEVDEAATKQAKFASIYLDLDLIIDNPDRIKSNVSYISVSVSDSQGNIISRANRQQSFMLSGNPEQDIRLKLKISTGQIVANLIEMFSSGQSDNFQIKGYFELPAGRINFTKSLTLQA